ncbi:MAG: PEP-CTERM sorting domain-containing protein [Burkholderiales bacterium]|jgi:hypothetical protein
MTSNAFKNTALSLALAAGLCAGANAATVVKTFNLDVSGIASNGALGDSTNATRSLLIGAGAQITGLSWDVNLATVDTSWLSEVSVRLASETGDWLELSPGVGVDAAGSDNFIGAENDLSFALGYDFFLGSNGLLNFEFFEAFDDFASATDAFWQQGSFTITANVVPEPGSYGLAAIALLGMGAALRRRATKQKA